MQTHFNIRPYIAINLLLAVFIMLIMVYSAVFSPSGNHPVVCVHEALSGEPCASCGMSRAFSLIIRGRLTEALEYNVYSLRLFLFFFLQLLMRAGLSLVWSGLPSRRGRNSLVIADGLISTVMFVLAFFPLMKSIFGSYIALLT